MANEKYHVIHKHSLVTVDGAPKLPTSGSVEYGEIAINYAKSAETLSIRNSENEIVTFSCDDKFNESFRVMSKAMCDLDDRVLALEEKSGTTVGGLTVDDLIETTADLENVSSSGKVVDAIIIKSINERLSGAESSASSLNTRVLTLESSATSANTRISTLESSASSVNTRLGNLESSAASANTRISTLESSASSVNTRITNLETSAASIDTRVTNLETSAGTLDTRLSNLEESAITIDDIINTEEAFSALTASGKVVDAKLIRDIIYDNEEVTSQALNSLNEKIIELSGATPDLNMVETEAQLSSLTSSGYVVDALLIKDINNDVNGLESSASTFNTSIQSISATTVDLQSQIGNIETILQSINGN